MKEKFKTLTLVFLMCTSLLLVRELWRDSSEVFSEQIQEDILEEGVPMDIIAPNKYLLNFSGDYHTLFYDESKHELWSGIKGNLKKTLESKDITMTSIDKEEFSNYNKKRSISFDFPEKLNTYILAKALGINNPNKIVDNIEEVTSIYVYLGSREPFFVFSNGGEHLIKVFEKDIDVDNLKEQVKEIEKEGYNYYYSMKEIMGTEEIYVPYQEMKNPLTKIFVENEIKTLNDSQKRRLAEKFFDKKIDYIREVVERNGSNIYIHNQRVLKLNENGSLEYFNSLNEKVKKRNLYESINTASGFLFSYTGLDESVLEDLYLSSISEIKDGESEGYRLSFKYRIRGVPIILGNREVVDFIEMDVFNDHIKSYKQFLRRDINKKLDFAGGNFKEDKILPASNVIDMNYNIFENELLKKGEKVEVAEDILDSIQDITLAYFDPCMGKEDELLAVWAIRSGEKLYAFDVYTGTLIYQY